MSHPTISHRDDSRREHLIVSALALALVLFRSIVPTVYEGFYFRVFPSDAAVNRWNAHNLGEFLFPESLLSLLPLAVWVGAGVAVTLRRARGGE